jgi:hypothetical protein
MKLRGPLKLVTKLLQEFQPVPILIKKPLDMTVAELFPKEFKSFGQ